MEQEESKGGQLSMIDSKAGGQKNKEFLMKPQRFNSSMNVVKRG